MPAPTVIDSLPNHHCRSLLAASILLAICLAALAFSASAQGAGSSALGWGYNTFGQTGNGAPTESSCNCVLTPTPVSGLSDLNQISGGSNHTLALHSNGTVTAWGYNGYGQLGNGTTTDSAAQVPVSGLANVVAVDAGGEHSLALLGNGTVVAWGGNYFGQLGLGSSISGGGPESCGGDPCGKVPVGVPGLSDVVAISAGGYFNLALLGNGTVMAWGSDYYGQLGDGIGIEDGCDCIAHPVAVPGVAGAMAVSAGEDHGMALLSNGALRAWGENYNGQLGAGTTSTTSPCYCLGVVAVGGLPGPAQEISAGGYHSAALLGGGSPWAWGYNANGELGNGSTSSGICNCVPTPGPVSGLTGVQSIAAGGYHTLALQGDGNVRAWGYNGYGSVGDGSETDRSVPVPVSGVSGANSVSTGYYTSFALLGPSHALTVSLAGAGAGTVGGARGIVCPAANCVSRFAEGQVGILRAEAAPGSGFAGFSGPCTGTGTCQVRMDVDQTVTATFGPPKGTAITRAKIKQGKKPKKHKKGRKRGKARRSTAEAAKRKRKPKPTARATFSFTAPGAVTGYQCMLVRPKPKRKKAKKAKHGHRKRLAGKKRAKPVFTPCASPKRYKRLRKGRYTFRVRALNILGADAVPAVRKFKVKR